MSGLWPEEESLASRLGGVFDEAMRPPETHRQSLLRIVQLGEQLRAQGCGLPQGYEQLLRNQARGMLAGHVLRGVALPECARAWLDEHGPFQSSLPNEFAEHWRSCATCQGMDDY